MKKYTWIVLIFICLGHGSYAQSIIVNTPDKNVLDDIPMESVFVHFNAPLLFAGEYLHYKLYVRNSIDFTYSNVSDIAYLELIGEDNTNVFKHKIRLENGNGNGDFFIPTTVPSGNYKILAYTQWMKNYPLQNIYSKDLSIINPYQENQKNILGNKNIKPSVLNSTTSSIHPNSVLIVQTDNNSYSKRSKVTIDISGGKAKNSMELSISVHHKSPIIDDNNLTTAISLRPMQYGNALTLKNDSVYLPELRGELISGQVISKSRKRNNSNLKIGFSIPGNDGYVLKVSTTDENGNFYVNLDEKYNGDKAIVQVIDENREDFELVINNNQPIEYPDLNFRKFNINPEDSVYIKKRSIHNQIENGYFSSKPDSILIYKTKNPFESDENIVYNLDDYTRFKTIKETFVEVIENAWTIGTKNKREIFQVRGVTTSIDYFGSALQKPLVILDGILIQDHNSLMDYDARKVQNIIINRHNYIYGHEIFKGIIIIETIDGNYKLPLNGDYIKYIKLFKPTERKKYFKQVYVDENKSITDRLPDYRYQLLWLPYFKFDVESESVTFYTSDVEGEFEISLEGFTDDGKPVSVKKIITVK